MYNQLETKWPPFQIAKTLDISKDIRHRSDAEVPDRCLIVADSKAFALVHIIENILKFIILYKYAFCSNVIEVCSIPKSPINNNLPLVPKMVRHHLS